MIQRPAYTNVPAHRYIEVIFVNYETRSVLCSHVKIRVFAWTHPTDINVSVSQVIVESIAPIFCNHVYLILATTMEHVIIQNLALVINAVVRMDTQD